MLSSADRLRQIAQLARAVSSELELETVLSQVTAALRALRPDVVCAIRLIDREAGGYRLAGTEGFPAAGRIAVVPFGEGLTHVVAEMRRPLLVENNQADPRALPAHWSAVPGLTTYYGAPIEAGGELLGVVNMNFPPNAPPTEDEQASIEVLAAQAAVAIRNARLFAEREERRRVAEALADVGRTLAQTLDIDVVAQRVADAVCHLLGARCSFLFQLRPDTDDLVTVAVSGEVGPDYGRGIVFPGGSGLAGVAVRTRKPEATPDFLTDARVALPPDRRRSLETATDRAVLAVPLVVQDRVIGALSIRDQAGRVFGDRERALAQAFADQAAVALENARLYGETERRRREAEELARIGRTLTESLDETIVADRIVQSVLPLFGVQSAILRHLRPDGTLVAVAVAGRARDYFAPGHVIQPGVGVVARAVAEGRTVARDTLDETSVALTDDVRRRMTSAGIRSILATPLRVRGEVLGVLALGDEGARSFSAAEVALLQAFADQAALALHNAQVLHESQTRQARLEALLEVTRELAEIQPVESLLGKIAEACGRLLDSTSVGFRVVEGDELVVSSTWGDAAEAMTTHRLKIGESLTGVVAATGQPLAIANMLEDPRIIPAHRESVDRLGYRSWLGVPVKVGDRLLGVLSIRKREPEGFSDAAISQATAFAAQAATALENARLYQAAQQALHDLAQAQEQLLQAQKMDAVGRLAGGVAHDFNNMLTVITGRAEMLLGDLAPDDPLHHQLTLIQQTADRAAALTAQLLAFSRKQVLQPKVLDLNAIVTGIAGMLRRLIPESIELRIVAGPDPAWVRADPVQLEQVILNLAVNARDAMPSGGRLTLETASAELDEAPGYVRLAVSDTGVGMDEATRSKIFEPFFTTKPFGERTGLGLAMVYGIVKQSGGDIRVHSAPGRGTTFEVYLPRVARDVLAPPETSRRRAAPTGTETILVVEDEDEVRSFVGDVLRAAGYTILDAPNPDEALHRAERHPGSIHLVVTDVVMPQTTGRVLAERLLSVRPGMKVLYISGYPASALGPHGVLDAGTAFLQKPFTPEVLRRKVRETLDRP